MSTVSIMPGIEMAAPERTETSRGRFTSPKCRPVRAPSCLQLAIQHLREAFQRGFASPQIVPANLRAQDEGRRHGQSAAGQPHEIMRLGADGFLGRNLPGGAIEGNPVDRAGERGPVPHAITSSMR